MIKKQIKEVNLQQGLMFYLSVRANNCLLAENINTFEDLLKHSRKSISAIPNVGRKSLTEIVDFLSQFGMELSKEQPIIKQNIIYKEVVKEKEKIVYKEVVTPLPVLKPCIICNVGPQMSHESYAIGTFTVKCLKCNLMIREPISNGNLYVHIIRLANSWNELGAHLINKHDNKTG